MRTLKEILKGTYESYFEYYDIQNINQQEYFGRKFNKTALKKEHYNYQTMNNKKCRGTHELNYRVRYFDAETFYITKKSILNGKTHLLSLIKEAKEDYDKNIELYINIGFKDSEIKIQKDNIIKKTYLNNLYTQLNYINTLKINSSLDFNTVWTFLFSFDLSNNLDIKDKDGNIYNNMTCFTEQDTFKII